MEAKDELIKARVKLQRENPFFSYLVMGLNLIEKKEIESCAVDFKGNLYYNPKFIEKLNQSQIKTLLSHEVLHIALLHLARAKSFISNIEKDEGKKELWNIATDLVINNTLILNNFDFGGELSRGLVPRDNEFNFKGTDITITEIDKKIWEEIYNLLNNKKVKDYLKKNRYIGFDTHILADGEKLSEEEREKIQKEWKKRLIEAITYSKLQGKEPSGLKRYVDNLLDSKLNWRELLYRYITQEIPMDYTYSYPSKRSQVLGVYLPRVKKELIDITIAVDTSGSIGKEELTEFLSEVVGIARSFESLRINIFFMDTQVNNHYEVKNGEIEDILNYEIKGGGGTDFIGVYKYIDEKIPNTRLLVFFTDGYASFPENEERKTIWVLTKNSCDVEKIPFGEVVKLE